MRRLLIVAGASWAIGTAAPTGTARAQCTYTPLGSGVAATAVTTPQAYSLNQGAAYWTGVAVRPNPGADWNLGVYQATDVPPNCVTTLLGSSSQASGVDLVVGDFNAGHNPLALYYPLATRASGGSDATVEWDDGGNSLVVNGPLVNRATGSTDVLEVWDVFLESGKSYRFLFSRTGADARLLLFKSGAGVYWAGRTAAQFEATANRDYTPTTTGYYGAVVINNDGVSGSYSLGVGTCTAPQALTSGVSVTTAGFAERYYSCDQNHVFWTAFGARGGADWNVAAYQGASGASYPVCLSSQSAASTLTPAAVDFVVGNFNGTLPAPFYARAFMNQDQGSGSATVEWDDGADFVAVDASPPVSRTTGPSDVLEVWDVYLTSGLTYYIRFNATGADLGMFLFSPGTAWAGRSAALLHRAGSPAYVPYTATQTGWHGLVVVNEDGNSGSYDLHFVQTTVDVADAAAPPTSLGGMVPNPVSGSARIDFALHEGADVSFEVMDVAGRLVSRTPSQRWSPGRWSMAWNRRGESRGRLSPGVYFLRMKVDQHLVGRRKFIVID